MSTDSEVTTNMKRDITSMSDNPEARLVWIDCEMTGLDAQKDTLLEVAVVITDGSLGIVAEGPNLVIHHPDSVLNGMGEWCRKQHRKSGLTRKVQQSEKKMDECENEIYDFLKCHVPAGKCPLAGNSVGQDAKFLERLMPKVMSHLHYRIVDVSTIKELVRRWYPDMKSPPNKKLTHRALDDILESIEELKFYRENVFIKE